MAKVKICGLSTSASVETAISAGADFIGLVFYPRSPRNVTIEQARPLADLARGRCKIVALIVDAPDELVAAIRDHVRPDFFQAHGSETPERIRQIRQLTGIPVIKAIKVAGADDVAAARAYAGSADLILFDSKTEPGSDRLPGGTGVAFDWTVLSQDPGHEFILSGGLTPENVAKAIAITGAPIVDVSSGVESSPGIKDLTLIRRFVEAARTIH